jgi:hypothetical protein
MNNTNHHDSGANPQTVATTLTKSMVERIHAMIVTELESKTRKSSSSGYGTGESVATEDIAAQDAMLEARFPSFGFLYHSSLIDALPRTFRHSYWRRLNTHPSD